MTEIETEDTVKVWDAILGRYVPVIYDLVAMDGDERIVIVSGEWH